MPLLTENSFQRLSDPILGPAEETTLSLLEKIKQLAESLIENPEQTVNREKIRREIEQLWNQYEKQSRQWVDNTLPEAYLRGIRKTEGAVPDSMEASFGIPPNIEVGAGVSGGGGDIAATAAQILDEYPRHHTIYTAFQDAAYERFSETRVPVVRDTRGKVRDLIILASEDAYKDADGFTRRKMTQQLMNRFADDNITGIRYADGRTMKLDTYSEMVARSQTGNAARQAAINRQQEYGLDLIQISQHFPTSDLCRPWQNRVYSLSGTDSKYPPLDEAISGGLYHVNSFEKETEVLTKGGWKLFKDVTKHDTILSLNPETGKEEWAEIELLHLYNFKGSLIHFYDEDYMDLRVTPDHMVFVWLGEGRYKLIEAHKVTGTEHTHITKRKTETQMPLHTKPEVKEIKYDDMVYCLTLGKNHIMWVRRNGKTTWSGNCKHFQSAYIPGVSKLSDEEMSVSRNREQYEATQRQREIERNIRKYKRREVSAITEEAKRDSSRKVLEWQKRNRDHLNNNRFLRRKYKRESVGSQISVSQRHARAGLPTKQRIIRERIDNSQENRIRNWLNDVRDKRLDDFTDRERRLLDNWVRGSKRKVSIEMKEAAIREFDLDGIPYSTWSPNLSQRLISQTQDDLRRIYNKTQKYFERTGKKTITLYRGVKSEVGTPGALSSWTTNRSVAESFDGHGVIEQEFPVSQILTGRGLPGWIDGPFGNQEEFIVLR